ncbi:hypothetical protein NQ317_015730 [Molorchus minor]|uniref:Uncharacterized protein n=1 Tax=Molorchus minor TaxID=1323400 RepID=A0ABQ9IVE8_9CUCU|nr:hypothetical protein NQ317_015730 [Molorchus minor]
MEKIRNNDDGNKNLPIPRRTLLAIGKRRETIHRKSQMFVNPTHFEEMGESAHSMTFDNPAYEEETMS